jgi:hypothetical protein
VAAAALAHGSGHNQVCYDRYDRQSGEQKLRQNNHIFKAVGATLLSIGAVFCSAADKPLTVDAHSFRCMTEMTKVRHFYVDNLLGNVDATVAAANAQNGAYPPGSVIQLVPVEAMVKLTKGSSPETNDWEFFVLDVSKEGTTIHGRGFASLEGPHGGFCFGCHSNAKPQFDLVCEADHGCVSIRITRAMAGALQRTDPRCKNPPPSAEDAAALKQLHDILKGEH